MSDQPPLTTIPAALRAAAEGHPDRLAVVDGAVRLDYAGLLTHVRRAARALAASDIGPGDRVAVLAPNCWQWIVIAFAAWDAGAVVVPISTRGKAAEIGPVLERTGARLLVTVDELLGSRYLDMLRAEYPGPAGDRPVPGLPELREVVLMVGTADGPGTVGWDAFLDRADGVDPEAAEGRAQAATSDDVCEVLFTSGTTGAPKGVMLAQGQLLRSYWAWSGLGGLGGGDIFLVVSPFSHGFGINAGVLVCVLRGMTNVPMALFEPAAALELIERERVTVLAGPPTLFSRMLDHPDAGRRDTSSLRVAYCGAATVPAALIERLAKDVGIERVVNAYGLIEACVVSMTRADDPVDVIATSTGRPLPGVEVRTVDDGGRDTPVGEPGEVVVRGDGVMVGYWRDPEATAAAVGPDGWLRTGDIGTIDEAGNVRIVDRKKDMFICGGFNAYPAEIEGLLVRHPAVAQVAVVGVEDDQLGEVGWAYVVPAEAERVVPDDVIAWARERMANYKVPRRVVVCDELPVNANGKVDKATLRRRSRPDHQQDR